MEETQRLTWQWITICGRVFKKGCGDNQNNMCMLSHCSIHQVLLLMQGEIWMVDSSHLTEHANACQLRYIRGKENYLNYYDISFRLKAALQNNIDFSTSLSVYAVHLCWTFSLKLPHYSYPYRIRRKQWKFISQWSKSLEPFIQKTKIFIWAMLILPTDGRSLTAFVVRKDNKN